MNEAIRAEALRLGFSHCGFSQAQPLNELRNYYTSYIKAGKQQGFSYLAEYAEKRMDPSLLLPGVKSVIALLMSYYPSDIIPEQDHYIIAKYAYGEDYHPLIKKKMNLLLDFIKTLSPEAEGRIYVDSGPVMEKAWAMRCGLGWQGKNTLLINKKGGSYYFIGIILTSLELTPDQPETDHCGECNICREACPTGALETAYELDISRCISYYTIENKIEIPAEIGQHLKDRIYGCDTCQDACPYNHFAKPDRQTVFAASPELMKMRKADWHNLTEDQFNQLFKHSAIKRRGYDLLKRNILSNLSPGKRFKPKPGKG